MEKKFTRILVVDDNEDVLLAAKMLLKQHSGIVITEKNPEMIPLLLNQDSFHVIFLNSVIKGNLK